MRSDQARAVIVLVAVAAATVLAPSCASSSSAAGQEPPAATAPVERRALSATVSLDGTLTHRARADGSPYVAINQARGTYTALPDVGEGVACGDELYRVDDEPVLLLCGEIPVFRDLHVGDQGNDVRQLNANLHLLGADTGAGVELDPDDAAFTDRTQHALEQLQAASGAPLTGALDAADVVFLPEPVRIAAVTGRLGGPATPGDPVLDATSDTLEVQVDLQGSQQRGIERGDPVRITLPTNRSVTGTVDRIGTTARAAAGPNGEAGTGPATLPASVSLDDPEQARGLDQAPVRVEVTTGGVDDALSVPVTAIVGMAGGGFAVEVVRESGQRDLVAVTVGLVDATAGQVQVEGDVREGDHVVVPSS